MTALKRRPSLGPTATRECYRPRVGRSRPEAVPALKQRGARRD